MHPAESLAGSPAGRRRSLRPMRRGVRVWLAAAALAATASAGCGDWPRDPAGTLDRARGGTLRAGAAEAPPWVVRAADGTAAGPEAELIAAFARSIGARVEWRWGSADELLRALERRELDVAAVGLTAATPWQTRVGLTRP